MEKGWRSATWLAGLPALLLLPGCGPSPEQMLQYEHVLGLAGILLGLGMWKLGFILGGRLGGKRHLCPGCGLVGAKSYRAGPEGGGSPDLAPPFCPRCGVELRPAFFDAVTLAKIERQSVGYARARLFKWTAILAAGTFLVLAAPSIGETLGFRFLGGDTGWHWLGEDPGFDNVYWFPIWFALQLPERYPGLGIGLFFYCYHFLGPLYGLFGNLDRWWLVSFGYAFTFLAMCVFWYCGLRRFRLGWLVPVIWGTVNVVWATLAYLIPGLGFR